MPSDAKFGPLASQIVAAVVTSALASVLGSILLGLASGIFARGAGGFGDGLANFIVAGTPIAFFFGLPSLMMVGIPICRSLHDLIDRWLLGAMAAGTVAGAAAAALIGIVLFGGNDQLVVPSVVYGAIFGSLWIYFFHKLSTTPAGENLGNAKFDV